MRAQVRRHAAEVTEIPVECSEPHAAAGSRRSERSAAAVLGRRLRAVLVVLAVVALVAVMLRLSLWQWDRGRASGRLVNYIYAVEWVLFAGLTVLGVGRLSVEGRREERSEQAPPAVERPVSARGGPLPVVGPPLRSGEDLEEITLVRLRRRLGLAGDRR